MAEPMAAPEVQVVADPAAAVPLLLDALRTAAREPGWLGLATGATFAGLWPALAAELAAGRLPQAQFTHLDEYLGFAPQSAGGMVHELFTACPPFAALWRAGRFLPVPHDGSPAVLAQHEAALQAQGGVALQLLGIGRNGHLAFNEPGTRFGTGFHVAALAETTRADARPRFRPGEPPTHAVTSGLGTIAAARRLFLCAFGAGKAAAVRAMLEGPVGPECPASLVQRHGRVVVVLDAAAAAGLARVR